MRVTSREYKMMLDAGPFVGRREAFEDLRGQMGALARTIDGIAMKGEWDREAGRAIVFLDTPDFALRRAGFILRRRLRDGKAEYTLKCRSEDRYFAAGADLASVEGFEQDLKFEEDIAPPFRCRFSHSNTIRPPRGDRFRKGGPPATLLQASSLFPILGRSDDGGLVGPGDAPLRVVNGITAHERVFTGARLAFGGRGRAGAGRKASVAVVLWADGPTARPLVVELSFRLESGRERYSRELSGLARAYFEALQGLGLARPRGGTKTEFIYRDDAGD